MRYRADRHRIHARTTPEATGSGEHRAVCDPQDKGGEEGSGLVSAAKLCVNLLIEAFALGSRIVRRRRDARVGAHSGEQCLGGRETIGVPVSLRGGDAVEIRCRGPVWRQPGIAFVACGQRGEPSAREVTVMNGVALAEAAVSGFSRTKLCVNLLILSDGNAVVGHAFGS